VRSESADARSATVTAAVGGVAPRAHALRTSTVRRCPAPTAPAHTGNRHSSHRTSTSTRAETAAVREVPAWAARAPVHVGRFLAPHTAYLARPAASQTTRATDDATRPEGPQPSTHLPAASPGATKGLATAAD